MVALCRALALALAALASPAHARESPPLAALTLVGPPQPVFTRATDACDGDDVPDAPARAFRNVEGEVVVFGMHYENRALRGPGLDRLKLDCRVVLGSGGNADPKLYDDKSWITATWTKDGRQIEALVHHEYQANAHPGRCRFEAYLACWYNTILAINSLDGGQTFPRSKPVVVAAAPFTQEVEQGRHRGFMNPSNIFSDGRHRYFFAATTGWGGQPYGACLFRSEAPSGHWRAWDGQAFSIRYEDPYKGARRPKACAPLAPFSAPVGAVVRHRASGTWIAVFQAKAEAGRFPESGFYSTSSRDLLRWDEPRLLLAGKTLYDDACGARGGLIAYPSLLDPESEGRNFDNVGDSANLFFATLKVEGCKVTSERNLVRRKVAIKVWL